MPISFVVHLKYLLKITIEPCEFPNGFGIQMSNGHDHLTCAQCTLYGAYKMSYAIWIDTGNILKPTLSIANTWGAVPPTGSAYKCEYFAKLIELRRTFYGPIVCGKKYRKMRHLSVRITQHDLWSIWQQKLLRNSVNCEEENIYFERFCVILNSLDSKIRMHSLIWKLISRVLHQRNEYGILVSRGQNGKRNHKGKSIGKSTAHYRLIWLFVSKFLMISHSLFTQPMRRKFILKNLMPAPWYVMM